MTGRTDTQVVRAVPDALRRRPLRKAGWGPMDDRGMAVVEVGVAMAALAATLLLAVVHG